MHTQAITQMDASLHAEASFLAYIPILSCRKALLVLNQLEVSHHNSSAPLENLRVCSEQWLFALPFKGLLCAQVEDTDEHIKTTIKAGGLMDVVSNLLMLSAPQVEASNGPCNRCDSNCSMLDSELGPTCCRWSATHG